MRRAFSAVRAFELPDAQPPALWGTGGVVFAGGKEDRAKMPLRWATPIDGRSTSFQNQIAKTQERKRKGVVGDLHRRLVAESVRG